MMQLKDVLADMQTHDKDRGTGVFSIKFLSCDRSQKKGGDWVMLSGVKKCGLPQKPGYNIMTGIYNPDTNRIIPVHNRLIFEYNGQKVYW